MRMSIMRIQLITLVICFPLFTAAQGGIAWSENLKFDEIKEKAQKENKYIFVDCFTSWCGPCKAMDKNVYPLESVGNFINANFISVKLQMDNRKQDNDFNKRWDSVASFFERIYNVSSYPCFLFFSPNGDLVHKGIGYRDSSNFVLLARDALKSSNQLYAILNRYWKGKMNFEEMRKLSLLAQEADETNISKIVARDYMENYLYRLDITNLYTKENLEYIAKFYDVVRTEDRGFELFYKHQSEVDEILGITGFSQAFIDNIITREDISIYLFRDNFPIVDAPDWSKMTIRLKKKYDQAIALRNITNARIQFFRRKKDWQNTIKYTVKKIENYGLDTSGMGWVFTNNMMFEIFKHCDDKKTLNKAIKWMEIIIKAHPNEKEEIDTYANLLYKVGRKKEAIEWEERAARLDKEQAEKYNVVSNKVYQETLDKMRKGQPTWLVK